jgi:hypothetical protein
VLPKKKKKKGLTKRMHTEAIEKLGVGGEGVRERNGRS